MKGKSRSERRTALLGKNGHIEDKRSRNLDKLAEYEQFDKLLMPKLKKMVLENWAPERIRKEFESFAQARVVEIGVKQGNLAALQDILNRQEGTPVQRQEHTHKYGRMDKRELAAFALQRLRDAGLISPQGVLKDVTPDGEKEDT
jgi:hypothetical protein